MAIQLRDRNKHPPGGYRFYQPETNWSPPAWLSFEDTVAAIIQHRLRNPHQSAQYGWPTEYLAVCKELDDYNARICFDMEWNEYIMGEGVPEPPPKRQPLSLQSGRPVVAGVKSLAEWTIDGEIVPNEVASVRAAICASCPVNRAGGLLDFFTESAAKLIQRQFEIRSQRDLSTAFDEKLGICDACGCPLKLKVHAPLSVIAKFLTKEMHDKLDQRCWILR